jgi:hypothetical protein
MKPRVIGLSALAFVILAGAGLALSLALKPGQAVPSAPQGREPAKPVHKPPDTAPPPQVNAADNEPAKPAMQPAPALPEAGDTQPLPSPMPPPATTERPPTETHEGDSIPPSLQPPPDLSMQVESIHRDMAALLRQFCGMAR